MTPRTRLLICALVCLSACRGAPAREPRRLAEMEAEDAKVRQRVATLHERLLRENTDVFGAAIIEMPTIEARVLALDAESRRVVLDKGKRDGVVAGYVFDLYRGAQYKGRIQIVDVQDASCTGSILHEMMPMEVGDSATTNL